MRMAALLLLLTVGCRTEPQSPVPPRITQLPKKSPITPSTDQEETRAVPAPAQTIPDEGIMPVRAMMTPAADREAVVAPPADAGPDAIVQLPPVPDAQVPYDGQKPVPETPSAPPSGP